MPGRLFQNGNESYGEHMSTHNIMSIHVFEHNKAYNFSYLWDREKGYQIINVNYMALQEDSNNES